MSLFPPTVGPDSLREPPYGIRPEPIEALALSLSKGEPAQKACPP